MDQADEGLVVESPGMALLADELYSGPRCVARAYQGQGNQQAGAVHAALAADEHPTPR